jgi:hypothetical protein
VPDRRTLNEYRLLVFGTDEYRRIAFVCECDDPSCGRSVVLNRLEYEDLRQHDEPVLFHAHLVRASAEPGSVRRGGQPSSGDG